MKCFLLFLAFWIQWNSLIITASARSPMAPKLSEEEKSVEIMRYAKAAGMKNFMNKTIDPCNDFYKYSCGNWAQINPAIKTTKNGIFNMLSEAYDRKVLKWLNGPKASTETDMERKVKYFYESCMNVDAASYNNRERILSIMEQYGGMPALKGDKWKSDEFDWLTVVSDILRKYGKQIIVGLDVSTDITNNEMNRLYIGQPKNGFITRAPEYYGFLGLEYSLDMGSVLGMDYELAGKISGEMVKFEKALSKGISDPLDGVVFHDKCKKRSLEDMTKTYGPTLNFTHLVTNWLGYDYQLPVYEYVETYLQNLKAVLENTTEQTLANYIMWKLVDDFRMEPEIKLEKQKTKCIETTKKFFLKYLDNAVYRQLLAKNKNLMGDLHELWQDLKAAYEETLLGENSRWMTREVRDKALEKLAGMTIEINSYEKEEFDKDNAEVIIGTDTFFDNVVSIMENRGLKYREKVFSKTKIDSEEIMNFTPGYAADFNRILIPASFMQPRFLWDPTYPVALKYATAGYVIAHEMTHGFDDNARNYDAKGNLSLWWDQKSSDEFLARKECLSQHYSEYKFSGIKMDRSNAQDENIADIVGIRVAFAAYEKWLLKQTNATVLQKEILPQFDLTPRQLFFVGLAQVWCTDVHEFVRPYLMKIDVHVPEEIRVAAMVSNFELFAEQFKCKSDAKMNPQQKCTMF